MGYYPHNIELYKLAIQHKSIAPQNKQGFKESNERLEYLGDAVLSMIVAEYLFKKYPFKNEGFLTEIRSRIVNREQLNHIGKKLGISKIVEFSSNRRGRQSYKSIYGDTLEALIGAVYLDRGYNFCRKFIVEKLLKIHLDIDNIIKINPNYKSKIIEWAHQHNKSIEFKINEINPSGHIKEFTAELLLDDELIATGNGYSKKKAEQDAAQKSCEILEI